MGRAYPDEVDELLKPLLAKMSRDELLTLARQWGFPMAPVLSVREVLRHPHLMSRKFFISAEGSASAQFPGSPFRSAEDEGERLMAVPKLGENTAEILGP